MYSKSSIRGPNVEKMEISTEFLIGSEQTAIQVVEVKHKHHKRSRWVLE